MARRRRGGSSGLWTLIIVGVFVAWLAGRSNSTNTATVEAPSTDVRDPVPVVIELPTTAEGSTRPPPSRTAVAYVTATTLNLRSAPSRDGTKVGALKLGARVTVAEVRDGWAALNLASGQTAWVSVEFLSATPPAANDEPLKQSKAAAALPNRPRIIGENIEASMRSYSGSCPCPENRDRAGRRCGGRSAWSRAGGARPICYASEVTEAMIDRYLARN